MEAVSYSASSTVTAQSGNKNPEKVATFDDYASAECVTEAGVLGWRRQEAKDIKAELGKHQRIIDKETERLKRIEADRVARDNRDRERASKRQRGEETATRNQMEKQQRAVLTDARSSEAAASKFLAKEAKELAIKVAKEVA